MKYFSAFTLVEILIVTALLAALSGFGLAADAVLYQNFTFRGQGELLMNLLRRARSQSMDNIGQLPHGVRITPTEYTLFAGTNWDSRDPSADVSYAALPGIAVSASRDFIFDQLSGSAKNAGSINIRGSRGQSITINVGDEGQIY